MEPKEKPAQLRWSALTHPGRFRKNNEDAFIALRLDSEGYQVLGKIGEHPTVTNDLIFAVSDGMGGANSGEFASRIAVQKIADLLPASFRLGALGIQGNPPDILEELFTRIHAAMRDMAFHYEECQGMGATLSLGWFTPGWMHYAHAGDSRIYFLPRKSGEIRQLTEDHTHVASMLKKGLISEQQARVHPERNVLYNVLGGKNREVTAQIGAVGYQPGDRFIFCSDGLTEGLRPHRMLTLLDDPPPRFADGLPAERLFRDALEESGRDNITVMVIEAIPAP